jgi:coproporphyrinogen III oxidase
MALPDAIEDKKARASTWFAELQGRIIAGFEALEDAASPALYGDKVGRFVRTPWQRKNHDGAPGGGGTMSVMHGRLFEKVGVHVSTVMAPSSPNSPEDPGRGRRSALLGDGHLADRP